MIERVMQSELGPLTLVSDGEALVGVYFDGHRPPPKHRGEAGDCAILDLAEAQLRQWLAGERRSFDLPLRRTGTDFQRAVWAQLDGIGFGERRGYGELARAIGRPKAARAVGAAVGRNPLSIVVPCHRVVGTSGRLTGFAGGVDRKRWLLEHEAAAVRPGLFDSR